jgi:hypothetical protein
MKRNFLAVVAVLLTLAISSFTVKPLNVDVYCVFDDVNFTDQTDIDHYDQTEFIAPVDGADVLYWIRILDQNDGVIDQTEFDAAFAALDQGGSSSSLNDAQDIEQNTTNYQLEKKPM